MGTPVESAGLELDLDSIGDQLTPAAAARVILALKSSPTVQARYEELALRCRNGELTEAERRELDQIAELNTLVGLLKARAFAVAQSSD